MTVATAATASAIDVLSAAPRDAVVVCPDSATCIAVCTGHLTALPVAALRPTLVICPAASVADWVAALQSEPPAAIIVLRQDKRDRAATWRRLARDDQPLAADAAPRTVVVTTPRLFANDADLAARVAFGCIACADGRLLARGAGTVGAALARCTSTHRLGCFATAPPAAMLRALERTDDDAAHVGELSVVSVACDVSAAGVSCRYVRLAPSAAQVAWPQRVAAAAARVASDAAAPASGGQPERAVVAAPQRLVTMAALRRVAQHPWLLLPAAALARRVAAAVTAADRSRGERHQDDDDDAVHGGLRDPPKMRVVLHVAEHLRSGNGTALVLCNAKPLADLVAAVLAASAVPCVRLDTVRDGLRGKAVAAFARRAAAAADAARVCLCTTAALTAWHPDAAVTHVVVVDPRSTRTEALALGVVHRAVPTASPTLLVTARTPDERCVPALRPEAANSDDERDAALAALALTAADDGDDVKAIVLSSLSASVATASVPAPPARKLARCPSPPRAPRASTAALRMSLAAAVRHSGVAAAVHGFDSDLEADLVDDALDDLSVRSLDMKPGDDVASDRASVAPLDLDLDVVFAARATLGVDDDGYFDDANSEYDSDDGADWRVSAVGDCLRGCLSAGSSQSMRSCLSQQIASAAHTPTRAALAPLAVLELSGQRPQRRASASCAASPVLLAGDYSPVLLGGDGSPVLLTAQHTASENVSSPTLDRTSAVLR